MGENGNFGTSNGAINAALSSMNSSMASTNTTADAGLRNATVANGQVLPHSLTVGVNTINYGGPSGVSGIGAGNVLFLATDLTTAWAGVDFVLGGMIVFVADSNLLTNLGSASNDNDRFFLNVATVPEPSTALLVALGLAGLGWRRRVNQAGR